MWEGQGAGLWQQLDHAEYKTPNFFIDKRLSNSTNLIGQAINTLTSGNSITTGASTAQIGSISYNMNDAMSFTN